MLKYGDHEDHPTSQLRENIRQGKISQRLVDFELREFQICCVETTHPLRQKSNTFCTSENSQHCHITFGIHGHRNEFFLTPQHQFRKMQRSFVKHSGIFLSSVVENLLIHCSTEVKMRFVATYGNCAESDLCKQLLTQILVLGVVYSWDEIVLKV